MPRMQPVPHPDDYGDTVLTIPLDGGAITRDHPPPVWHGNDPDTSSWAATITGLVGLDSSRSGLRREYWTEAHTGTPLYHLPRDLTVGKVVEFGAKTGNRATGRPRYRHWYGLVSGHTPEALTLQRHPSGQSAWHAALAAGTPPQSRAEQDTTRELILDALHGRAAATPNFGQLARALVTVLTATERLPLDMADTVLTDITRELGI